MLVKVCPKCGSENSPSKASCSGCYASLEGVPETEGKERPAATPPQPPQNPPSTPQPLGQNGPRPAATSYSPPFNERRQPVKQGPNWGAIVLVLLLLGGAAFGGWWLFLKPASPEAVVKKFNNATVTGDFDAFRSCLSEHQATALVNGPGGEQASRDALKRIAKQVAGKDTSYEVVKTTYENSGSLAVVEIKPNDTSRMSPGMTTSEMVLVRESGQWKVDTRATTMRMIKKLFPNGVPRTFRPRK
jgi:hypothetical protein